METLILVIDDSPTIRKIVEISLQREGFAVQGCHDGIEAMRWLAQSQTIPALILLDINLPQMDGFEVTRRITRHQAFAQTVVIMLSRRDGLLDRLKGRLAGAQGYITKPFQTEHLLTVVKASLGAAQ